MKKIFITGYKPTELSIFKQDDPKIVFIKKAIEKRLLQFIEEGLEWVLISGQMGVELWTGQIVAELQEMYDIKLGIIPPFENQESRWPEEVKYIYEELTMIADFYQPLYKGEYKAPYQFIAKNKWLIDKTDGCLILLDDEYPGSNRFFYKEAKLVAEQRNYPIYTITPLDLDDIVQEIAMDDPDFWG